VSAKRDMLCVVGCKLTEPHGRDGRLGLGLLDHLLDLILRLAHALLLLLQELGVRSPLLGCLGLEERTWVSFVCESGSLVGRKMLYPGSREDVA
jgi:hypothetical protein